MSHEYSPDEGSLIEEIDFTVEQLRTGKLSLMTDLDGTRVRTAPLAIEIFNGIHHTSYSERDITTGWAMVKWAEERNIENPVEYCMRIWNSYKVMAKSFPVQGAAELAKFLYTHRNSKTEIPAITARPGYTRVATNVWHKKWMPWVEVNTHLFMRTDAEVNHEFKISTIKAIEPSYFLEDQIRDAEAIAQACPNTKVVLVSQPWNDLYVVPDHFSGRILKPEGVPGTSKVLRAFYAIVRDVSK
jgi:hypothetical protein